MTVAGSSIEPFATLTSLLSMVSIQKAKQEGKKVFAGLTRCEREDVYIGCMIYLLLNT